MIGRTNVERNICIAKIRCSTNYLQGKSISCSCTDVGYIKNTKFDNNGECLFIVPALGIYIITSSDGGTVVVNVDTPNKVYDTTMFTEGSSITFTINGAKNDNITIKDTDNNIVGNVLFDENATSKEYTMQVPSNGALYTFTSSIAKDVNNDENDYVKQLIVTHDTTEINVRPDGVLLYWYDYENEDLTGGWVSTGFGWPSGAIQSTPGLTKHTHYMSTSNVSNGYRIGCITPRNAIDLTGCTNLHLNDTASIGNFDTYAWSALWLTKNVSYSNHPDNGSSTDFNYELAHYNNIWSPLYKRKTQ